MPYMGEASEVSGIFIDNFLHTGFESIHLRCHEVEAASWDDCSEFGKYGKEGKRPQ